MVELIVNDADIIDRVYSSSKYFAGASGVLKVGLLGLEYVFLVINQDFSPYNHTTALIGYLSGAGWGLNNTVWG